jgi:hypothetical protein
MRPHALLPIVLALLAPTAVSAQDRRADRGEGIPTSLFGTYIAGGDVLVYPFYEYTKTSAFEYKASEFGLPGEADFLGETVEQEWLVFFGYGFTDGLAVELEMALHASTTFDKAPDDPSASRPTSRSRASATWTCSSAGAGRRRPTAGRRCTASSR